jgi:hypothetical protein
MSESSVKKSKNMEKTDWLRLPDAVWNIIFKFLDVRKEDMLGTYEFGNVNLMKELMGVFDKDRIYQILEMRNGILHVPQDCKTINEAYELIKETQNGMLKFQNGDNVTSKYAKSGTPLFRTIVVGDGAHKIDFSHMGRENTSERILTINCSVNIVSMYKVGYEFTFETEVKGEQEEVIITEVKGEQEEVKITGKGIEKTVSANKLFPIITGGFNITAEDVNISGLIIEKDVVKINEGATAKFNDVIIRESGLYFEGGQSTCNNVKIYNCKGAGVTLTNNANVKCVNVNIDECKIGIMLSGTGEFYNVSVSNCSEGLYVFGGSATLYGNETRFEDNVTGIAIGYKGKVYLDERLSKLQNGRVLRNGATSKQIVKFGGSGGSKPSGGSGGSGGSSGGSKPGYSFGGYVLFRF